MNVSQNARRAVPPVRREPVTHLFAIGEIVRMKGSFAKPADIYHITARLPAKGDELQYRIRNDDERHERVTTQGNLEATASLPVSSGASLVERTFGSAQGKK